MVESIKIDKNLVNVDKFTGQAIEFDPHWKEDGVPGMVGQTGVTYAWKDPDEFKEGDEAEEGLTHTINYAEGATAHPVGRWQR